MMIRADRHRIMAGGVLAAALLSGCGLFPETRFVEDSVELSGDSRACTDAGLLGPDGKAALDFRTLFDRIADWNGADRLLDCVIGTIPETDRHGTPFTREQTMEMRVFRGHMVVTLLARYGMLNYTGTVGPEFSLRQPDYKDSADDAGLTLTHIETAETLLRSVAASLGQTYTPIVTSGGLVPFENADSLHRLIGVLQIVVDVHRPMIPRTRSVALDVLSAAGGNVAGAFSALRSIGRAIGKGAIVHAFSDAYARDTRTYWEDVRGRGIDRTDWRIWDRKLVEACEVLKVKAGLAVQHCEAGIPSS